MMTRRHFLEAGVGGVGCPYELYQCGTVFKLTPPANGQTAWTHTVLHRFGNSSGGANPLAACSATHDRQI